MVAHVPLAGIDIELGIVRYRAMKKTGTAMGFLNGLKGAWGTLQKRLGGSERDPHRRDRRLAPLQELEDRRLLSGITIDTTSSAATVAGGASSLALRTPSTAAAMPS